MHYINLLMFCVNSKMREQHEKSLFQIIESFANIFKGQNIQNNVSTNNNNRRYNNYRTQSRNNINRKK